MRNTIALLFLALTFSKLGSYRTRCEQETVRVDRSKEPVRIKLKNGQQLIGNRKVVRIEKKFSIQEKIVYEFLGIPFAQAPLGEKRFEFPHKLTHVLPQNIYDATYSRSSCWQEFDTTFPGFRGSEMWNPPNGVSEDCLYFNLWVPVTKEQDSLLYNNHQRLNYYPNAFRSDREKLRPTLFWIYGGSFNSGSSNLKITDGTIISSFEDAIMISSNYRVGPFGFLFLNSSSAPGNAGLADQVMALEWYKENYLDYFGGSRDQICLFGESAGSISINLLLLSNKAHIFNRGILQSLSSYLDIGFRKPHDALKISLDLAQKVGCVGINESFTKNKAALNLNNLDTTASQADLSRLQKEIHKCLLKQNSSILSQLQFEVEYVNDHLKMQFLPTMDYHGLIADDPLDFRFEKLKAKVQHEILIGINYDESTFFSFYNYYGNYFDFDKFLKPTMTYDNEFVFERLVESLRTKKVPYFKISSVDFGQKPIVQITYSKKQNQLVNEHFFNKYTKCLFDLYSNEHNKYRNWDGSDLNFDLDASGNKSPQLAWKKLSKMVSDVIYSCPTIKLANRYNVENSSNTYFYRFSKRSRKNPWPEWLGVIHGYEIEYIFGMPWVDKKNFDDDDRELSRLMMSYWANFARTGKLSSPHDRLSKRDFFVELGPMSRNLTEQEELEMFNSGYPMCDYLNNYVKPDHEYAGQLEQCLNYQNDKMLSLSSTVSNYDIYYR
ncbi:cholinesterase isoform X1 [Brachionus plicatilis]|uniref:Cholinesterase isoform X1 n=1 Tax=Brachionus plicatilis TaxID=10195 RepID=A0A3M7TAI5_BRAPC|nr:cholinesterase isoform X1 [Brachionus plicatilis]